MASSNFTSDSGVGTTSCDGYALISGNASWSAIRNGSGTSASATGTSSNLGIQASNVSNKFNAIARLFFIFDTSSIPVDATVTSATLYITPTSRTTTIGGSSFAVSNTTTGSNTNISSSDYALVGDTVLSNSINTSSLVINSLNPFTLNSTGLTNITKGGITKLAVRENSYDIPDIAPTWVSSGRALITVAMIEYGSAPRRPYLTVTYTEAGGNVNKDNFFLAL